MVRTQSTTSDSALDIAVEEREAWRRRLTITVDAARALVKRLRPHAPRFLLDLGSGRAWPGAMVAEELGCRLVASDVPCNALVDARAAMRARGVAGDVAVADGCWLPFQSSSFDGLIHSDVFC